MQIGFFGLLTLIFIVLKLVGIIHWSWFWVILPSLPGLIVLFIVLLFVTIYFGAILLSVLRK